MFLGWPPPHTPAHSSGNPEGSWLPEDSASKRPGSVLQHAAPVPTCAIQQAEILTFAMQNNEISYTICQNS